MHVHERANRQLGRDDVTGRVACSSAIQTKRASGAHPQIIGSSTCKRKARLDGRQTKDNDRVAALSRAGKGLA
jgi:hypothetical protein